MPLVAAKCTQCGAEVQVDNNQKAAICEHCGMAYVVEDAITNYNVKLHADNITVQMDGSIENRLKAGYTYVAMKNYEEAHRVFGEIVDRCPYDCRGWICCAKVYIIRELYDDFNKRSLCIREKYMETIQDAETVAKQNGQMDIFNKHKPELERIASELDQLLTLESEIEQAEREVPDYGDHEITAFFLFLVLEFLLFCAGVALSIKKEFGTVNAQNFFALENLENYGGAGMTFAVCGIIPVIIILGILFSILDDITGKAKVREEKVQEIEKKEQAVKDNKEKLEQQITKLAESIHENFINL